MRKAAVADGPGELGAWRTLGEATQLGDFDVDRARQAYDKAAGLWYEVVASCLTTAEELARESKGPPSARRPTQVDPIRKRVEAAMEVVDQWVTIRRHRTETWHDAGVWSGVARAMRRITAINPAHVFAPPPPPVAHPAPVGADSWEQ